MGKASILSIGNDGENHEPVDVVNSIGHLHAAGRASNQSSYSTYTFPLPDGARLVKVYYRTWGSDMYPTFWLYLALGLYTADCKKSYVEKPNPLTKVANTFGCESIDIIDGVLRFTCNCPDGSSGGYGIDFTAFA